MQYGFHIFAFKLTFSKTFSPTLFTFMPKNGSLLFIRFHVSLFLMNKQNFFSRIVFLLRGIVKSIWGTLYSYLSKLWVLRISIWYKSIKKIVQNINYFNILTDSQKFVLLISWNQINFTENLYWFINCWVSIKNTV